MFNSDLEPMTRMLGAKRIAIVGLSDSPDKPSYQIAEYLIDHGFEVIPVNPNHREVLGQKCYASLKEIPGPVDVVNVFRRPEHCPQVAREAIAARAKGLWLQVGIRSPQARQMAKDGGIDYVEDRCFMVEHSKRGLA